MKKKIMGLNDVKIDSIEKVFDYFQIFFSDGTILNVYNPCSFVPEELSVFNKLKVIEVDLSNEKLVVKCSADIFFTVDLKSESFSGPEALELTDKDGNIFVWQQEQEQEQ